MKLKTLLLVTFLVVSGAYAQKKNAGNYAYKTECMGV